MSEILSKYNTLEYIKSQIKYMEFNNYDNERLQNLYIIKVRLESEQ